MFTKRRNRTKTPHGPEQLGSLKQENEMGSDPVKPADVIPPDKYKKKQAKKNGEEFEKERS